MASTPAELFERHHRAIYRYVLRTTGSAETAEDITQEVFLRVVKRIDIYEERDQERAWLFRIARNLRCDYARREYRRPAMASLDEAEPSEPARQDLTLRLEQALAALDEDERDAFVLAEVGGFSYVEIAVICGTTSAAIRSRIYRARLALRTALDSAVSIGQRFVRGTHV